MTSLCDNGHRYEGEMKNGMSHGIGKYTYADKRTYEVILYVYIICTLILVDLLDTEVNALAHAIR